MSIDSLCEVICNECGGGKFVPVYGCAAFKKGKGDPFMSHREPVDGEDKCLSYGFTLTCQRCGGTEKTFGDEIRKEKTVLGIFHKTA